MRRHFDRVYAESSRGSVPPYRLVRALVLQVLHLIRSERLLMELPDYKRLFRWFKAQSAPANLHYLGHFLMEHRTGLRTDVEATEENGYSEREGVLTMLDRLPRRGRRVLAANDARQGGSMLDGRTACHAGYRASQRLCKLFEGIFDYGINGRPIRTMKARGLAKVDPSWPA